MQRAPKLRSGASTIARNAAGAAQSGTGRAASSGSTRFSLGSRSGVRSGGDRGQAGSAGSAGSFAPTPTQTWVRWWDRNQDEFLWTTRRVARKVTTAASRSLTGRGRAGPADRPERAQIYTQIVPNLLAIMDDTDDEQLLDAAIVALGRTVAPPFEAPVVDAFVDLLDHSDLGVRSAAALGLGLIGSPEGTAPLLELATCSQVGHRLVGESAVPDAVRAAAALALGYINDPQAVPSLIDLVDRLADNERELKTCVLLALGMADNEAAPEAAAYLTSRLTDRRLDPAIQSAVPTALARLGRPGVVAALLDVLDDRDTDTWVAQSAVLGLGHAASLADDEVRGVLVALVEDARDGPTRQFALMALARLGARDDLPEQHSAAHDEVTNLLRRQLRKPRRSQDRPWAGLAAGLYARGQPARAAQLTERLALAYDDVKDPARRGAFALGLGLARHTDAAERLRRDFDDLGDEGLRGHIALALGLLGDVEAEQSLRAQLTRAGTSLTLRRSLAAALRMLGDDEASTIVGESYADAGNLTRRAGLATALGQLRERRSIPLLMASANDDDLDPASRAFACSALGLLAEKSPLPWTAKLGADSNFVVPVTTLDRLLDQP